MKLQCQRCDQPFEHTTWRGYCDVCLQHFAEVRTGIHQRQRPAPGVIADGKFADDKECPRSFHNPVANRQCCGLCGSEELEQGYGLGSGFGMGVYTWCDGCEHFLDFSEDKE